MKKMLQWCFDWSFCYVAAWLLIITFPLWLPIKLARWVKKNAYEYDAGASGPE